MNKLSGFTLIEMLIVVVIIGVLVAIVAPRFGGQAQDAKRYACMKSISNINQTLLLLIYENNYYSTDVHGLFPTGNMEDTAIYLNVVEGRVLKRYFDSGTVCPYNPPDTAFYVIKDGMVDASAAQASHKH